MIVPIFSGVAGVLIIGWLVIQIATIIGIISNSIKEDRWKNEESQNNFRLFTNNTEGPSSASKANTKHLSNQELSDLFLEKIKSHEKYDVLYKSGYFSLTRYSVLNSDDFYRLSGHRSRFLVMRNSYRKFVSRTKKNRSPKTSSVIIDVNAPLDGINATVLFEVDNSLIVMRPNRNLGIGVPSSDEILRFFDVDLAVNRIME